MLKENNFEIQNNRSITQFNKYFYGMPSKITTCYFIKLV